MAAICPGCTTPIGYNTDHDCDGEYTDTRSWEKRILSCECSVFTDCKGHKNVMARVPGVLG